MAKLILIASCGGALGSALRYSIILLSQRLLPAHTFPYATFAVNLLGGFAIGLAFALLSWRSGTVTHAFLIAGLLGGFTTFSAFSFEIYQMMLAKNYTIALFYSAASVCFAIGGVWAGVQSAPLVKMISLN